MEADADRESKDAARTGTSPRTFLLAGAAVLGVLGFLSLVIVSIQGIAGAQPSIPLTWIGMIGIPLAFLAMAVELVRSFLTRRATL